MGSWRHRCFMLCSLNVTKFAFLNNVLTLYRLLVGRHWPWIKDSDIQSTGYLPQEEVKSTFTCLSNRRLQIARQQRSFQRFSKFTLKDFQKNTWQIFSRNRWKSAMDHVYGHIILRAPDLVRSLKLSIIEWCEYGDGWLLWKPPYLRRLIILSSVSFQFLSNIDTLV